MKGNLMKVNCEIVTRAVFEKLLQVLLEQNIINQEKALELNNEFGAYGKITKNNLVEAISSEIATRDFVIAQIEKLRGEMITIKSELKQEIAEVRAEIANFKVEVEKRFSALDKKMSLGFITVIAVIIITNPQALELIKTLFGLAK